MDKSQIAIDVFNKRAQQYQEKFMDVSAYAVMLDAFCEQLLPNAKLLELACGPGNITKYLLNKRPDLQILATDLAPNMLELAKANNPGIETKLFDCRDINTLAEKYDGIMCSFCLPYLSKEEAIQLTKDAAHLLHPNGLLYLSTMEGDYTRSAWQQSSQGDELFIYMHEADYLLQALHDHGFDTVDTRRVIIEDVTDLVLLAAKWPPACSY
ncbi:class I SAM-dependent DNA methyltransferase [Polluticoccus soli]|uniref:class I SAM-dependent DNA methyltransferase n=1 Tax=Polluticoccus soli TaxID=3034150 RepID=UPI0023E2364C|nr:class I SAM-dependent methyltransferase [Flavipsychrobacter sp. JY13-12]